jgi:hypothetical protein
MGTRRTRLAVVATAIIATLLAAGAGGVAQAKPIHPDAPLTVMTRNLYLGANIMRPVTAALTQPDNPLALPHATDATWQVVEDTRFPVRAALLAGEIEEHTPDLVGLQEVALWRTGPLEITGPQVAEPNAQTVRYDFLRILLDTLAARGEHYTAVSVQEEADVESPSFAGVPGTTSLARPQDVRLTMRDVILVRDDSRAELVRAGSGQYDRRLAVPVAGRQMEFVRGYNWVDVRIHGKKVRFVNTHFEAFGSDHALAQARELLAGPAAVRGSTVVIACDCNSDPLDDRLSNGVEHRAPYQLLTGAGGFTDQWLQWADAEDGWTSGLGERVRDGSAAGFDHRIDLVLARTPSGKPLAVTAGAVTGTSVDDRDPATGLWPSDHGGVVLTLAGSGSGSGRG